MSNSPIFMVKRCATIDVRAFFPFSNPGVHDRERMREQMTALPAFETLLTLRILARRARLTPLYPAENDDITIKLPSAYGNWLNYQISSTNINTSTRNAVRGVSGYGGLSPDDGNEWREFTCPTIGSTFAFIGLIIFPKRSAITSLLHACWISKERA